MPGRRYRRAGRLGGAFTVTLGLEQEFPDRMLNTPIAELGFFGAAVGAAIMGMRPIVDVQYGDFLFLAMDQIVNNAAKLRYMSGGTIKVPLVMRAPIGATGRGSQHAQSMERYFTGVPGIKVVAVSNAYDAKGILKSAVRDDNPVLIFEHKLLYGSKGARTEPGAVDATSEIPEGDYTVPLDRAAVRRAGNARDDPRLAVDGPFRAPGRRRTRRRGHRRRGDRRSQPLLRSTTKRSARRCKKTGRVVVVEEGPKTGGVSAEIAAGITERFGDSLLAPVAARGLGRRAGSVHAGAGRCLSARPVIGLSRRFEASWSLDRSSRTAGFNRATTSGCAAATLCCSAGSDARSKRLIARVSSPVVTPGWSAGWRLLVGSDDRHAVRPAGSTQRSPGMPTRRSRAGRT